MKRLFQLLSDLRRKPENGLQLYSSYEVTSNCESAVITLYKVKKEFRHEVTTEKVAAWVLALGAAFPDRADVEDSRVARGLPSSYAIQFVFKDEVVVLDVGNHVFNSPIGHKHVDMRHEREIAYGEYDLIATINKQSVRDLSPKVRRTVQAA